MRRHCSVFLTLASLCAIPVSADEVQLKNGDRLTGRTVSLVSGTLTFSTPFGDVSLPWVDVTRLVVDEPILVRVGSGPPAPSTLGAAAVGQAMLQRGGVVPLADITALTRPEPAVVVNGGASAGLIATAGNTDVNSLRVDGDLAARAGANRYTANAAITRARDRGAETARNWATALKYDRFLTERLFLDANTVLASDRFRDLDLRTAIGAGVGYQVLNSRRITLTADGGVGYVNENLESQPDDSYTAARESASLRVFAFTGRVELFHQHDGYFGVTGDDNLFLRMQNGARFALAAGLVVTLRHDLDYDRSPALGRQKTDRTFAATLGYRF